jgi:Zn-dependent peptidase ImmA (M78 family)
MERGVYYERMRQLAREKRAEYGLRSEDVGLAAIGRIYKAEGIRLDRWDGPFKKLKAAYILEDGEIFVLVRRSLPLEPRLFAQVHELKHHYEDQGLFELHCWDVTERSSMIEIGAEEFAAEFIYPLEEYRTLLRELGIRSGNCSPEQVVRFKMACPAKVSYTFIRKRLERLRIIAPREMARVQFQRLQEQLYGVPFYKRRSQKLIGTRSRF